MQDRILSLERQLDDERQQRQELQHKLDKKTEELLKEQRARTKLKEELQTAKGDRAKLARTKEELRLKQEELQLTTSKLQKHDLTLRQTHIQFARTEEVSKAEAFEGDVEKFWRNRDVEAIIEGMQRYQRHVTAVMRGFMALTSLAHDRPELQQQIATVGGIKCTCEAMRAHSTSASLQLQEMCVCARACACACACACVCTHARTRTRHEWAASLQQTLTWLSYHLPPPSPPCPSPPPAWLASGRRVVRFLRWQCTMTTSC